MTSILQASTRKWHDIILWKKLSNTYPQFCLLAWTAGFCRAPVGQRTKTASSEPATAAARWAEEGLQTITGSTEQSHRLLIVCSDPLTFTGMWPWLLKCHVKLDDLICKYELCNIIRRKEMVQSVHDKFGCVSSCSYTDPDIVCLLCWGVMALPSVRWWTACCTTWQRPRHWGPDWYWRWQPQAGRWPGPIREEETIHELPDCHFSVTE